MQLGLIGLGKMGFNLAINCSRNGHEVVAFDLNEAIRKKAASSGISTADSLPGLVSVLKAKRVIWLMITAGTAVDAVIAVLKGMLVPGDIIIDGGNSNYKDSMRRATELEALGIGFLDCGSSGGVEGALNGLCLMVGGKKRAYDECESFLQSISVANGCLYCGEPGAGHFVKMVHNGIEYGMMQSIGEGFELMKSSGFDLDYKKIAGVWNNGSVIRSWLMELTERAFEKDPALDSVKGIVHSSGEGKWMVETALEKNVSTPVIALSLMMRYRSLQQETFAGKLLAALRREFGGHEVP